MQPQLLLILEDERGLYTRHNKYTYRPRNNKSRFSFGQCPEYRAMKCAGSCIGLRLRPVNETWYREESR